MARVFPRTAASSSLNSVLLVARREHDRRIGVGRRFHLFRLPGGLEHGLAILMSEESYSGQVAALVSKGQDELIHDLATMASGRKAETNEGPVKMGLSATIAERASVEGMAAHYRDSFENNRRTFPYFDLGG